ncbi:septum formation initiator family protein [Streptomyces sp. NPDC048483]|uniref:septum formation initiator family protein n=1 Tax=Streptomyces sp. NPDC048483 TaxID=3154927 RepID=UPI003440E26B
MKPRGRPGGRTGRLAALFPAGTGTAARTPFVLLIVVLLGSGLITLLLLNSALNQGSFELSKLEKKTDDLTDEQQALQQEVDAYSAPAALVKRARKLGMVPGGNPVFLMPDGTVRGRPGVATGGQGQAALSASAGPRPAGPAAPVAPSLALKPSVAPAPPAKPSLPSPSRKAAKAPGPSAAPAASATPHRPAPTTPGR